MKLHVLVVTLDGGAVEASLHETRAQAERVAAEQIMNTMLTESALDLSGILTAMDNAYVMGEYPSVIRFFERIKRRKAIHVQECQVRALAAKVRHDRRTIEARSLVVKSRYANPSDLARLAVVFLREGTTRYQSGFFSALGKMGAAPPCSSPGDVSVPLPHGQYVSLCLDYPSRYMPWNDRWPFMQAGRDFVVNATMVALSPTRLRGIRFKFQHAWTPARPTQVTMPVEKSRYGLN